MYKSRNTLLYPIKLRERFQLGGVPAAEILNDFRRPLVAVSNSNPFLPLSLALPPLCRCLFLSQSPALSLSFSLLPSFSAAASSVRSLRIDLIRDGE